LEEKESKAKFNSLFRTLHPKIVQRNEMHGNYNVTSGNKNKEIYEAN
jgi:hypothetical protein